ncbi:hypothetical protein [Flavobacterium sp.]|uniref:hypothetical protein n=1 Tax=Flavobacterium sp. TaxID=239 RepID=UPI0025CE69EA|nr:hypothetical protein [Flavobacterium sp.]
MKKLKITFEDWDYECGDGCCTSYGTYISLNDERLEHPNPEVLDNSYVGMDVEQSLEAVLKKLGYEVEFEHKYEE